MKSIRFMKKGIQEINVLSASPVIWDSKKKEKIMSKSFRFLDIVFTFTKLDVNTRYRCSVIITQSIRTYTIQSFWCSSESAASTLGEKWYEMFFNRYDMDKVILELTDTWEPKDSPKHLISLTSLYETEEKVISVTRKETIKF